MKLQYGFNEIDGWGAFALGEHKDKIHRRLRLMGTKVVRVFVFDKPVPDPFSEWPYFASVLQAVLDIGAKPMVTFAKFHPPFDRPRNIARFVSRCSEVLWGCIEQWGGEEVKEWYWCVWNEPNNPDIGGGVSYEDYLRIYRAVGTMALDQLGPHLRGAKLRLGGPAIDGTQRPFWMDWIARLVEDVDDRILSFVNWHMYADWRPAAPAGTVTVKLWDSPDSPNGEVFRELAMAQTAQYEARAKGVSRLLEGRDILNACGELNTIAHHDEVFTQGLNRNIFGAAYYASALIHLIRGGADMEMRWTATSKRWLGSEDTYGLISIDGDPTPAALGKQLFAQHVRQGDWIAFPSALSRESGPVDAIVAWGDGGRRSGVFVNTSDKPRKIRTSDWDAGLARCAEMLRLDAGTGCRIVREAHEGIVSLDGYGIAVVTNATDTELD
jgi:hypothetical protein